MQGNLTQHFQDSILRLAIEDTSFLTAVRSAVALDLLSSGVTQDFLHLCYNHYDEFKEAPQTHFQDEAYRLIKSKGKSKRDLYLHYLKRLEAHDTPQQKYVLRRLSAFIKTQTLNKASLAFVKLIKDGRSVEAENLMYAALKAGVKQEEAGYNYLHEPILPRDTRTFLTSTGIPAMDSIIGGYNRSQFISVWAPYKGAKSWYMMLVAKAALIRGLNVLHISHEMTSEELFDRYDMMFGALCDDHPHPNKTYDRKKKLWVVQATALDLRSKTFKHEQIEAYSISDTKRVRRARNKVKRFGGSLRLRKYPMASANMYEVERYINYLESFENWVPDIVINDYADILAPMDKNKAPRDQIDETYKAHKRLADERNILVVTASQVHRSVTRSGRIYMEDVAEDARKCGHTDISLALCQTDEMEVQELYNVWIVASRNTVKGVNCWMGAALCIGQPCRWSYKPHKDDDFIFLSDKKDENE